MSGAIFEVIKALSSLSSMFMNVSPAPSMYRIHKQRSCGEVQVLPLLSFWGSCNIWTLYGYLSGSIFPLFATFVAGSALAVVYLAVYVRYTTERQRVRKLVLGVFLWNALLVLFSFSGEEFMGATSMTKGETGDWIGYIAVATSITLYASPFATLARVIKTKSVATIPIAMVVVGWLSNSLWVAYGVLDSDTIVVVPNVICVTFGIVQTVVYVVFSSKGEPLDRTEGIAVDLEKKEAASLSTVELGRSSYAVDGLFEANSAFQALKSPV